MHIRLVLLIVVTNTAYSKRVICLIMQLCFIITGMCSSDKMTSALLAMSLSYYCVMEEQMKKERKMADKILSTLLTCNGNNVPPKYITSMQCTYKY